MMEMGICEESLGLRGGGCRLVGVLGRFGR
jgi:hypothetical protein